MKRKRNPDSLITADDLNRIQALIGERKEAQRMFDLFNVELIEEINLQFVVRDTSVRNVDTTLDESCKVWDLFTSRVGDCFAIWLNQIDEELQEFGLKMGLEGEL